MSYEPKYCCQCGDKIERANWGFLTSRRFCQLCETDFGHLDWMPRAAVIASLFLTAVSLGFFFLKPEKNIVVSSNQPPKNLSSVNQNSASTTEAPKQFTDSTISQTANGNISITPKPATGTVKPLEKTKSTENPPPAAVASSETIYYCGAQTKKGTPCTRRVKGGGRCWQHTGQPAMLPQEKLIAN